MSDTPPSHMPFSEGLGYEAAFYSLPDPVFVYDHTRRKIILSNPAAVSRYGFSEEEFRTMGPWDIEAPYDESILAPKIDQLRGRGSVVYRTEHRNAAGETFQVEMHTIYQEYLGADIFVAICRKLTERIEAERRLEKAETHYRAIFENSVSLISVADLKTGFYLDVNPAFELVLGYSREELLSIPFLDFIHPDDLERSGKLVESLLREGQQNNSFQNRCRHKQGHYVWLDWSSRPLADKGLAYSVAHDISEQKWFEEKLRTQNQHMRLHVEQTPLGVIEWGLDFRVSEWNQAAERIFGYTKSEALGQHGSFILPVEIHDKIEDTWSKLVTNQGGTRSVNGNVHKDGSLLLCEWHNTCMVDAKGNMVGVASLVLDVTEPERHKEELKRAKEAAEKANQAKSEFLSMMSHELRTPLNSIVGPCELLKMQCDDENLSPLLDVMLASSSHLLELINSILDLAKIESGTLEPDFEYIAIEAFFEKRVSPLVSSAQKKGLSYVFQNKTAAGSMIRTDGRLLLQVMFNVIGNAIKFTESGRIEVTVNSKGEYLCIKITDTGIGISEDQQKTLFQPFRQGKESLSKSQLGTGLGLAITKKIVELLGGEIDCESKCGVGSVFSITLPSVTESTLDLSSVLTSGESSGKAASGSSLVLLVEDEPNNKLVTSAILKHLNYHHDIAESGEEAVELWKRKRYSIVLMDVKLPTIDGVEATRQIKQLAGEDGVYIIAQSAFALTEQKEKFLAGGMDDYISKPISIPQLKAVLEKAEKARVG